MSNPLLEKSKHPHGAFPFDVIKAEHFIPALKAAIETARNKLELYKKDNSTNFHDVLVKLDDVTEQVYGIYGIFENLHSAECPEELDKVSEEISSLVTAFSNDIGLDADIFRRIKSCYETRAEQILTFEEKKILEKTFTDFKRNGALLSDDKKEKIRKIDEELAQLSLGFSQNVLKATNAYLLEIKDKKDLDGLPDSLIEAAAELAEKKGKAGSWCISLQAPMLIPFITYAKNRELRKEIFLAQSSRCLNGEFDNQENIKKTLKLRHERAQILGYKSHADYVLEQRMAESPDKVASFLNELSVKAKPHALKEVAKLKALRAELEGTDDFQRYDSAFYSEILKKRELDFDDEMLRPFFKLENVIDGVFTIAKKLYQLDFKEVTNIPKYHEDVRTFEVYDERDGKFISLFYADFFPRETKKGGAWMTNFRGQGLHLGEVLRPHVAIVCNFTKPTKTKPSLLSLDEVLTLFHEFGHALHGMLSQCRYKDLSGTNVYWDFVELPSQIMENWVLEKECLDIFGRHYETGEKISDDLVKKIKASGHFLEGMATMRQLSFAILDMNFHSVSPETVTDIVKFEERATAVTQIYPNVPGTSIAASFSHIFAGGYSAGYYSYKWAEVLDADAFEYFQQEGIFNAEVAKKFRENILEKGGTEHPMVLYKKFRGQEPDIGALLRRSGLE